MQFGEVAPHVVGKNQQFAAVFGSCVLILFLFALGGNVLAQTPEASTDPSATTSKPAETRQFLPPAPVDIKSLPKNLFVDQKNFWTAPLHMSQKQWEWAPAALLVGGLFIKADQTIENHVPTNKTTVSRAVTASNAGVGALAATGAGLFLLGHLQSDDQKQETGILAGEAAIGALADTEIFKYAAGRERPFTGTSPGRFFVGGDSFPSAHASISWAIASVIAHEYPGPLTQLLAYGTAGGVSAARWAGQKHFFSDVAIGAALGWYMGREVYRSHSHYSDADMAKYGTFIRAEETDTESQQIDRTRMMGSPYLPLDSWAYPALERLAALGYIHSASLSLRPWTRIECARLILEAANHGAASDAPSEVRELYDSLSGEFAYESQLMNGERNLNAQEESAYSRFLGISGTPLTDNYHFGQTLLNDYGRPYQKGFNPADGASGYATAGPLVLYVRGEYQYAPSASGPTQAELTFFHQNNSWPTGPSLPVASVSRFKLLDTYLGVNLGNWQFSFGRNSLWWGPSDAGNMTLTNNAAPLNNMFTVDRVSPLRLPWLFRYLGDIRFQGFIGHLSGSQFLAPDLPGGKQSPTIGQYGQSLHPQPFFDGAKLSFTLTPNLEVGLSKTTIFGGQGFPATIETFWKSTFGLRQATTGRRLGDGHSFADFSYRVPYLRDWLTFYGEAFSKDEASPIPYMNKSAFQGGLYFAKLPKVPRLDLRLEGGSTVPYHGYFFVDGFYTNDEYLNGYTNGGQLMGSWIGRASQGELIQTNYWLAARKKIGLELRHRKIDVQYLPQGGNQNDVAVNADIFAGPGFRFRGSLQYERWLIPLLAANRQSDVAASFEFSFWPTPRKH